MSDGPDPTLALDGLPCPTCKQGVVVAYPVEWGEPAQTRCRECGASIEGEE